MVGGRGGLPEVPAVGTEAAEMINQELLAKRLMRGALTGHPETEKPPAKYCKGKLDNGRPCMITVLDGDYCRRHQKEIDALEAGAPLQPGRVERPFEERIQMSKKGTCKACSKGNVWLVAADMCIKCRDAAKEAGTYPEPASIVPEKVELVEEETKLSDVTTDVNKIGYDDEQEKAMLAGGPIQLDYYTAMGMGDDTENLAHAPASATNLDPVACLQCEGPVERQDLFCKTCAPVEPQITPIAPTPPQEQAEPCAVVKKGIAALLPSQPAPPAPPIGLHIPFSLDELAILEEFEVSPEHIRQVIIMGLEGHLCTVDASDPLAMSRHAAE